jgi:hypothetical protein
VRPRAIRLAAILLLLGWFFVDALRDAIPLWLPFGVLVALEAAFLAGAWRERDAPRPKRGRPPQQVDVDELGGEGWRDPVLLKVDGHDVWIPAEVDEEPQAPPERRPWAPFEGLALLAVLALVLFVLLPDRGWDDLGDDERARTEARLSREAARIAGHPVRVRCDAEGEAVGVVQHADGIAEVGGTNALLTPAICLRLHRLANDGDEGSFSQTARAIAVLAHEAWHLQGVRNEGVANCYAFQSGVEIGRRLGLSRGTAARMMRQQLAENAIQARAAPAYLVPAECRDDGELDLDRSSSGFP